MAAAAEEITLPVVDLASPEAGKGLMAAFRDLGVASVVNHEVDDPAGLLRAVRNLFLDISSSSQGYIPPFAESGSSLVEAKEGFAFGDIMDLPPDLTERPALERAYADFYRTSRAIVDALETDVPALRGCCDTNATALARLFHYLPSNRDLGSSPHTDWGLLTLVLSDDAADRDAALEVWHDSKWRRVRVPDPTALVVNAGDYLALVSPLRSPRHRVVVRRRHRYSLVFFYYPDYNATVPEPRPDLDLSLFDCQVVADDDLGRTCAADYQGADLTFGDYVARKWREVARPALLAR
ncbi:hypothetical protein CTAYLR_007249 [Chrysophaeum taylorii]|uniref:Fe2OG dioxygenase domain-containing protein n=1 Tax=Chrysophaeum taylorii TaxID=2483200 RepID=A0AAD7XMS0_9STRA|nr:hypothetical protein CTAYLR_007249 [Chrysophaeum taylorii]